MAARGALLRRPPPHVRGSCWAASSLGHSAITVDKLLLSAPGRRVYLRRAREPRKLGSELGMECLRRKAHNLETAALLGAVRPERRHDNMPTWLERPTHGSHVAPARQGIAEEVKHGAVVPEIVGSSRQLGIRDVSADPL